MRKMRMVAIALLVATVVWAIAVGYAFASAQPSLPPNIPRSSSIAGIQHSIVYARKVFPTENSSEWLFICAVKGGTVIWSERNEIINGEYKGELTEPLHEYVKNAIRCADERPGRWIVFPDEEFDSVPIETGIYKYEENYYSIAKWDNEDLFERVDYDTAYAVEHAIVIRPPAVGSGVALGFCWLGLGLTYKVKQRNQHALPT